MLMVHLPAVLTAEPGLRIAKCCSGSKGQSNAGQVHGHSDVGGTAGHALEYRVEGQITCYNCFEFNSGLSKEIMAPNVHTKGAPLGAPIRSLVGRTLNAQAAQ